EDPEGRERGTMVRRAHVRAPCNRNATEIASALAGAAGSASGSGASLAARLSGYRRRGNERSARQSHQTCMRLLLELLRATRPSATLAATVARGTTSYSITSRPSVAARARRFRSSDALRSGCLATSARG